MNKSNLILASVSAIIFTSILIIFSPNSQKLNFSSPTPSSISTESISPTLDPTADWKTYTNDKYNFSFKYPSYLHQIKSISSSNSLPSEQFQSNDYQTEDTGENTTVSKGLSLAYTYNYSMDCDTSEDITKHELNITTMDNHEARRYFVSWEGMIFYAADIFLPQSCLHISLNYGNNYNKDQILDIFNQILSTFKFTDTNISPASELLNKLNQKLNANLAFKDEIIGNKTAKVVDLSDYYNLEFSKNGGKLDIIEQTLTDFGLVYNPKLDTSDVTSWGNSYQSAKLSCDLSGNEEFLWLRCY